MSPPTGTSDQKSTEIGHYFNKKTKYGPVIIIEVIINVT